MADSSPITLISDLALILCAAGVTTLIFKKLKQPVVLGYIIAGFLVGPHFEFFPSIANSGSVAVEGDIDENIRTWSNIGVIFLLFSLGLEFSFKKLMKIGGVSSITSAVQIISMLFLGYFIGQLLGWSTMDSIFLGAILCISSTTIIIRSLEELNLKDKKFARAVFGSLIVEDLVAILLMVMLSTISISRGIEEGQLLFSLLKLLFFLILWFAAGIFFIPTLLRATKNLMNDETLLVASIGLCFAMVLLAEKLGFSQAFGAFITGSILAETLSAERIERIVRPVRDLFGAVFFVSVGMMIVPSMIVEYAVPIIVITLVTIFGKTISTFVGALLAGQPLKQSVQTGASFGLIGEFSFIIAQLGLTLKVTSDFLYPITIAVSAITTFTAPYLIKNSESVYNKVNRILPNSWLEGLNRYSTGTHYIKAESEWRKFIKSFLLIVIINGTVIIGLIILFSQVLAPYIFPVEDRKTWESILIASVTLMSIAPFLWALVARKMGRGAYAILWMKKYNRGPIIVMELVRLVFAILLVGFLLDQFFSTAIALTLAATVIIIAVVIFSQRIQAFSAKIEKRFIHNYNARELKEAASKIDKLSPWDAHIAYYDVPPLSFVVGKKLSESSLREHYGINIAMIERGDRKILVPGRDEIIYPNDKLSVIGTDEQLLKFKQQLDLSSSEKSVNSGPIQEEMDLIQLIVGPSFSYTNMNIRESGIREKTQGLIVGIERDGERILNPSSDTVFKTGDSVWIVGNKQLVKQLIQKRNTTV